MSAKVKYFTLNFLNDILELVFVYFSHCGNDQILVILVEPPSCTILKKLDVTHL